MEILLSLGIAMLAGLLLTRLTRLMRLPNVTAYLLAGVIIGPSVLGWIDRDTVGQMGIITSVALGFIAFSIGNQFKISILKQIGKPALVITACESLCAVIFVDVISLLLGVDPAMSIVLGALAASTAPAATLMVVRQYKADGPLTRMLLPVVAADDATGLIAYSISINIAIALVEGKTMSIMNTFCIPLGQIILALLIGGVLGILVALSHRFFASHTNRMSICIMVVLIAVAISDKWGLSSLLMCMAIGAAYVNLRDDAVRILTCIDDWTYPLFMLFFVISGASLDLSSLPNVGLIGIVYICVRFFGKWLGSYIGASMVHQPDVVKKNIGFALMPQAGVAIGMATLAASQLKGGLGSQVLTIILSATLVYELVGPLSAKFALSRAGEIHQN